MKKIIITNLNIVNLKIVQRAYLVCIFSLVYDLTTMSNSSNNFFLAEKHILTIQVTQIICERTFNQLKKLKTYA